MPADPGRFVVMGRLLGAFGVRGWVRVEPFSVDPQTLLDHASWWLGEGEQAFREHRVVESRMHGALLIAKVEGIETREDAQRRRGGTVALPRDALPAPAEDEVYWIDLPGLTVVNRDGATLGRVVDVMDNGAHGILRVRDDEGVERLIPNVPAYVDAVDLTGGRIEVDWQKDY